MNKVFLSIIIPCYNEDSRASESYPFKKRLIKLKDFFDNFNRSHELIFVTDGCTDETAFVIDSFIKCNSLTTWRLVKESENKGKGYAIRSGIKASNGQMILFMDADISVPLVEIHSFIRKCNAYSCVIGNRYGSNKKIYKNIQRSFVSKCSRTLIKPLLPIKVSDTQCGFKLFPRDVVLRNINAFRINRWLFDVELLMVLMHSGVTIIEVPVNWDNTEESTVSRNAVITSVKELLLLYLRKHRLKRLVQKTWH